MYPKSSLLELKRRRSRPREMLTGLSVTPQFICSRVPRLIAITALFFLVFATLYRLSLTVLTKSTTRDSFCGSFYNELLIPLNTPIPKKIWQLRFTESKLDVPQVTADELLDGKDKTVSDSSQVQKSKSKELNTVKEPGQSNSKQAGYIKVDEVSKETIHATKTMKEVSGLKTIVPVMHSSTTRPSTGSNKNFGTTVQPESNSGSSQAHKSISKTQDRLPPSDSSENEDYGVKETQFAMEHVSESENYDETLLEDPEQSRRYAYDLEDEVSDSHDSRRDKAETGYQKVEENKINTFSKSLSLGPQRQKETHKNNLDKTKNPDRVTEVTAKIRPTAISETDNSRAKYRAKELSANNDATRFASMHKVHQNGSTANSLEGSEHTRNKEAERPKHDSGPVSYRQPNYVPVDGTIVKAMKKQPQHREIHTMSSHTLDAPLIEIFETEQPAGYKPLQKGKSDQTSSQANNKRDTSQDNKQAPLPSVIASHSLYSTMVTNPDFSHTLLSVLGSHAFAEHYLSQKHPDLLSVYISLRSMRLKAEITRFLILAVAGGYWVDLDTVTRRTFDELIPYEWRNSVGCIVGVEYDQAEYKESQTGMQGKVLFARWMLAARPNHPLMEKMVLGALRDVHRLAIKKSMRVWEMELSDAEIESLVGAETWADEVMKFLRKAERGTIKLSGMKEPQLFGDVLVLPLDVLGAWQAGKEGAEEGRSIRSVVRRFQGGVKF